MSPRDPEFQGLLDRKLPELVTLERLIAKLPSAAKICVETNISHAGQEFPIYSIVLGSSDRTKPTLAIIGGIHGLERIGSHVAISFLDTVSELMAWDQSFLQRLENTRLVFLPIVNPVGMYLTRRSNGNGVDLMRNSPTMAVEKPKFLLGGQRFTNALPFFRGNTSSFEEIEKESKILCEFIEREVMPAKLSLSLDIHSGFGAVDRLWFPYAKTTQPPPHLVEMMALKRLFDQSYPNHFYHIEPQAASYTTHGDLWDWLFDKQLREFPERLFLPWTLELGSWIWMKKNPRQIFSSLGAFNPIQAHRLKRILRRHLTLIDFFHRALISSDRWVHLTEQDSSQLLRRAMNKWYDSKN